MADETRTAASCLVEEQVNIPFTKVHYRLEERLKESIKEERYLLYGTLQIKLLFESVLNNKFKDEKYARPVSESLICLEDLLRKEPYFYDFFQMKRLFERVLNDKSRFEQSLKSPIFLEESLRKNLYSYGYFSYYGSRHLLEFYNLYDVSAQSLPRVLHRRNSFPVFLIVLALVLLLLFEILFL